MVQILFQHPLLILRWLLIYQRLKKSLLFQSLTKSTRKRAKPLPFFLYLSLTLEARHCLFHKLSLFSKTIKSQIVPSPVLLASKLKPKVKLFAQAEKTNIPQQALRFAPALSHKDFLYLIQFKKVFYNLSQATTRPVYMVQISFKEVSVTLVPQEYSK